MGTGKSIKRFAVTLILTVAFSSLTLSGTRVAFAQQSSAGRPMFRNDSAHTEAIANAGPTQGVRLWSYVEGHFDGIFIGSSAAVVDGVVYVNSPDNLYALGRPTPSPSPTLGPSPKSHPTVLPNRDLFAIVASVVAIVIAATLLFLVFKKKLKTAPSPKEAESSPESTIRAKAGFSKFG